MNLAVMGCYSRLMAHILTTDFACLLRFGISLNSQIPNIRVEQIHF